MNDTRDLDLEDFASQIDRLGASNAVLSAQVAGRDAKIARLSAELDNIIVAALDALRPPCPRECDQGVFHEEQSHSGGDIADMITGYCPENQGACDGFVPWTDIIAVYQAVWDEQGWTDEQRRLYHFDAAYHAAIHLLRAVKA